MLIKAKRVNILAWEKKNVGPEQKTRKYLRNEQRRKTQTKRLKQSIPKDQKGQNILKHFLRLMCDSFQEVSQYILCYFKNRIGEDWKGSLQNGTHVYLRAWKHQGISDFLCFLVFYKYSTIYVDYHENRRKIVNVIFFLKVTFVWRKQTHLEETPPYL